MIKIFIFFLIILSSSAIGCEGIYLDRKDFALSENISLDILEEYQLEKSILITTPKFLNLIRKVIINSTFIEEQDKNKLIIKDFLSKTTNQLEIHPIKSLKHPLRDGYFIQQPFNQEYFYSFIIYFNSQCLVN